MTRLVHLGKPVPKGRPRFYGGVAITPRQTRDAERQWRLVALSAAVRPILQDAVSARIVFHMPTRRRVDLDNLAKLVFDALNGIAWDDDARIQQFTVERRYDRENPRTELEYEQVPAW